MYHTISSRSNKQKIKEEFSKNFKFGKFLLIEWHIENLSYRAIMFKTINDAIFKISQTQKKTLL